MPLSAPAPAPQTTLAYASGRPGGVAPVIPRTRGLHGWILATLLAMFPLIWFGGLTTSHGAGMSVPDWPNTYGYNMFAVPWDLWLGSSAGGIFFEHTHRLLGSLVGFFALSGALFSWGVASSDRRRRLLGVATLGLAGLALLCFVLMRADLGGQHRMLGHLVSGFGGLAAVGFVAWLARNREPRAWVRWTVTALLIVIIIQGVLGGLRVTRVNLELAIVHGVLAQVTLCLTGFLVMATGARWQRLGFSTRSSAAPARPLLVASAVLTFLVFAQLVVAASMRHYGAGMAVPDFPLSYGQLVPPVSLEGLERANDIRVFDLDPSLPPTTLGHIWLHTAHRVGALLIVLAVAWLVWRAWKLGRGLRPAWHVGAIVGLVLVQACLGVATVWMNKAADIATAHVAFGALLLLGCWLLTVRAVGLYGIRPATAEMREPAVVPAVTPELRLPVSA